MSIDSANLKLRSFKDWNTRRFNFVRELRPNGFAFGKKRIRDMLHEIDTINLRLSKEGIADSLHIHGVRINLCHSFHGSGKPTIDVLFVPINKQGKNFFNVQKIQDHPNFLTNDPYNSLLNTSSPCPDVCH